VRDNSEGHEQRDSWLDRHIVATYNERLALGVSGTVAITLRSSQRIHRPRQRLRRLYRHPCGGDQVILDYTPLGTITDVSVFGDQRQVLLRIQGLTFQNYHDPRTNFLLKLGVRHRGSS